MFLLSFAILAVLGYLAVTARRSPFARDLLRAVGIGFGLTLLAWIVLSLSRVTVAFAAGLVTFWLFLFFISWFMAGHAPSATPAFNLPFILSAVMGIWMSAAVFTSLQRRRL